MDAKLTYHGEVRADGLHVFNQKIMDAELRALLPGKEVTITIERKRKKRSNPQNRYYWSAVVPIIRRGLFDVHGVVYGEKETHEFLKANFNADSLTNEKTGEVLGLPKSTTGLSTTGFEEYMDRVREFAVEYLGVDIPLPNEQARLI